jgi:hypothetical protein
LRILAQRKIDQTRESLGKARRHVVDGGALRELPLVIEVVARVTGVRARHRPSKS